MHLFSLIVIAFSLSADAFAVALTNGISSSKLQLKHILSTGFIFGFFQGFMPILGYILCHNFFHLIYRYHHYIALILLLSIGLNMIWDAIKERKNSEMQNPSEHIFTLKNLCLQGIATSIDALAAGVTLTAMRVYIPFASLIIGVITCICCIFGVCIGGKFGSLLGTRAKIVGGILLILIGLHIYIDAILFHN